MAKREKKPVHKVVMTEGKRQIIQQLLQEYDIETVSKKRPSTPATVPCGSMCHRIANPHFVRARLN